MALWWAVPPSCGTVIESYGEITTFLGNIFVFANIFLYIPVTYLSIKQLDFSLLVKKPHRINLPKRKRRDWLKDFEKETNPAEHDLDAASEASSEPDYNYEFAQMEVIMKTLNSNGETLISFPVI